MRKSANMVTLLSECHFWTTSEENKTVDSAFRYSRNRELHSQDALAFAKRDYTERRNGYFTLKHHRKASSRLKDNIKKIEDLLRNNKVVYSQWKDAAQVLLLFTNGIIAHICIDNTGDILHMVFEKYLVGKLASDVITDAFFTRSHIVLAYNTNQLTVVYLQKPNIRAQGPEKIANMDPRIFHVIISGPTERKLSRHLSVNRSFDLFVVWTKSSQNEVYPWRPTIRDQDRANIHVFKLKGINLESISYCWSENDPLCVDFLRSSESQILTLEQKVSRKGETYAEICSYEINLGKMPRSALTLIPMGNQICCCAFSPDQEKIFLGTIERGICIHNIVKQNTTFLPKIDITPKQCSWHCDSSIVMISNDRSQFQCFDLALSPIGNQLLSEDILSSNMMDLSHFFTGQSTLQGMRFSCKPDSLNFTHPYAQTDCFLLLLYENGPIGCLRFLSGTGMRGDIHNSGLTTDVLVDKYLSLNQMDKAVNLLIALNWETYGAMCLMALHRISNYVFFRCDTKRDRLELMTKALNTFTDALSEETKDEFSDQVFDLRRRFFFFLLRNNLFIEAFKIAEDIKDYDLFMDLYNLTKTDIKLIEISAASFSQAATILHEQDRANGNLSIIGEHRSESFCSQSTYSEMNTLQSRNKYPHNNYLRTYVPQFRHHQNFKSKSFNADMIKINIPKPELRLDTLEDRRRTTPPPPPPPVPAPPLPDAARHRQLTTSPPATLTTLATLSIKSGSNPAGKAFRRSNTSWMHVPEQTVGIPTLPIASAHNKNLQQSCAALNGSTSASNVNAKENQMQSPSYLHYATPAVVAEHAVLMQHRTHHKVSNVPLHTYQPKFYQHPLVSGTIPPKANISSKDDYQKRLLAKKPTASILSNGGSAIQNGNSTATLQSTSSNMNSNCSNKDSLSNKNAVGEKNKVKFSDTILVAVVPVG